MGMRKGKKAHKIKPTFEESFDFINQEIRKRTGKWSLSSLNWIDYDDVSQIIRLHIYEKWHLYDVNKPLGPWLNRIISNQIKNLIRNHYGNFTRPCLKCEAADGEASCKIYKEQCSDCPLYEKWERSKKSAYNIKIPLALEDHSFEVNSIKINDASTLENNIKKLHLKMKEVLRPNEWIVYETLYVENLDEQEAAERLGLKSNERNRKPGYKQIQNIKKSILKKVKENVEKGNIEIL
tara:strand:- start:1270 stop:1980 length:711 start_codon:yes stop_codon:yes gene_type:complete